MQILTVRVDEVTFKDALARIEQFLLEDGLHQIATINPEFVVLAQKHSGFHQALQQTALNVPDGVGLVWASRRLGMPLKERVTGQELVDGIAALAAKRGDRVFMLGAREGIASRAAESLVLRHPGLAIVACYAGSPSIEEEEGIIERVNSSGANILFVAYGPPKQELWIARNSKRLDVTIAVGVGGTFDTLAGIVPRAPAWMRRSGLEWTYRLLREPRRLRRQLAIPYFMWLVISRGKK